MNLALSRTVVNRPQFESNQLITEWTVFAQFLSTPFQALPQQSGLLIPPFSAVSGAIEIHGYRQVALEACSQPRFIVTKERLCLATF